MTQGRVRGDRVPVVCGRNVMTSEPSEPASAKTILHDGWGELILSRPHRRNALTGPMASELRAGLASLLSNGVKAVVLRGDGGAFCSGLDVDAFASEPPPAWRADWGHQWRALHRDLYSCPAVIIGALERFAINGGASLALACDLLVAGESAFLMVAEATLGMHAPMNVAWLRLRTSESVAAQLLFLGRRVMAADLQRLGLVHSIVADAETAEAACAMGATLAGYPGDGLATIKAALRHRPLDGADMFDLVQAADGEATPPTRINP